MEYFMYICPACKKVYKVKEAGKSVKCSNCKDDLLDMSITIGKWEILSPQEKENLKSSVLKTDLVKEPEKTIVKQESNISNESTPSLRYIYCCYECRSFEIHEKIEGKYPCQKCGKELVPLKTEDIVWKTLDKDKKKQIISSANPQKRILATPEKEPEIKESSPTKESPSNEKEDTNGLKDTKKGFSFFGNDMVNTSGIEKSENTIICPECGKSIGKESNDCPNCGYPLKKVDNTIKCPECGNMVSATNKTCPECGYPLAKNDKTTKCPECGNMVSATDESCPECGYPLKQKQLLNNVNKPSSNKMIIGIVLVFVGIVFAFLSYKERFMGQYEDYSNAIDSLEDDIREYKDSKREMQDMADSFNYGFFKSSYKELAKDYQYLIDLTEDKIEEYEQKQTAIVIKSVLLLVVSLALLGTGGYLFIKNRG